MGRLTLFERASLALVLVAASASLTPAATFSPISGTLSIRAGEKPTQSTPAVLGSASLTDNNFPTGLDFATASLQTALRGGSELTFRASASAVTDVDPVGGNPRASSTVSFTQIFTTTARQWLELSARVEDDPLDTGTAAVVSLTRSGQPTIVSIGHTADATAIRTGLFPAGQYVLSTFINAQALSSGNHDANVDGVLLVAELADFNTDGVVTGSDLNTWQRGFGETSAAFAAGNLDGDGDVDGRDFLIWQRQVGTAAISVAAIPEPGTLLMCAACVLIAALRRSAPRVPAWLAGGV